MPKHGPAVHIPKLCMHLHEATAPMPPEPHWFTQHCFGIMGAPENPLGCVTTHPMEASGSPTSRVERQRHHPLHLQARTLDFPLTGPCSNDKRSLNCAERRHRYMISSRTPLQPNRSPSARATSPLRGLEVRTGHRRHPDSTSYRDPVGRLHIKWCR